jgi:hypothetical protein
MPERTVLMWLRNGQPIYFSSLQVLDATLQTFFVSVFVVYLSTASGTVQTLGVRRLMINE